MSKEVVPTESKIPFIKRMIRGTASSALNQAILGVQAFILVPFFLHAWGNSYYGKWLVLTSVVSYMALLDFGSQNYVANLLAMDRARGDKVNFTKNLSEGVSLFLFLGVISFFILVLLLFIISNTAMLFLSYSLESWKIWVLVFLGCHMFLLAIPAGIYVTAYWSAGLFVRGVMLGNLMRALSIVVSIWLLYIRIKPIWYAAAILGMGVLTTIVVIWDTRRYIPECRHIRISLENARLGLKHLRNSFYFWLIAVAQVVNQQGVVLVLATVSSPIAVALYATHRTFANISNYGSQLIQGPIFPELSFLWAQKRFSDLKQITFFAIKILTIITGSIAIFLWFSAPLIYPIWTARHLEFQGFLFSILLIQGVLAAGWSTSVWSLVAANHHRVIARWSLANGLLTVCLAAWLVRKHGIMGVAIASLVGDLVCGAAIFPILASSFLKISTKEIYRWIFLAALALIPVIAIAILTNVFLQGWWFISALFFICVGFLYPMMWISVGSKGIRRGLELFKTAWS